MENNLKVFLKYNFYFNLTFISRVSFLDKKKKLKSLRSDLVLIKGVSRIWGDLLGEIFLEFFDGTAVRFNSVQELIEIGNIAFVRLSNNFGSNELSYIKKISQEDYNNLKLYSELMKVSKEFSFYGEFYKIKNSDIVLLNWNSVITKNQYFILGELRAMVGFDDELYQYFPRKEKERYQRIDGSSMQELKLISYDFSEGIKNKSYLFKNQLGEILNIDLVILDYSLKSLEMIDKSLRWNRGILDVRKILLLLVSYVGEVLISHQNMFWDNSDKYNYTILKSKDDQIIDLNSVLEGEIEDGCFFVDLLTGVYNSIVTELGEKAHNNR